MTTEDDRGGERMRKKSSIPGEAETLVGKLQETGSSRGGAQREDPKPTGATKSPEESEVSRAHSNNKPHR